MNRDQLLERLERERSWDFVVIGGGATGLGIAVDAASRGFRVALLEQADFTKSTSSKVRSSYTEAFAIWLRAT